MFHWICNGCGREETKEDYGLPPGFHYIPATLKRPRHLHHCRDCFQAIRIGEWLCSNKYMTYESLEKQRTHIEINVLVKSAFETLPEDGRILAKRVAEGYHPGDNDRAMTEILEARGFVQKGIMPAIVIENIKEL